MAPSQDSKIITLAQLSSHNTQQDLWIAVYGKVYNLTSFAPDHPGGIDVLKDCAGTDGSSTYEYAGHSATAMKTMQRFLVGRLAESTSDHGDVHAAPHDSNAKTDGHSSSSKSAGDSKSALPLGTWIGLPLLLTIVSIFAGWYWSFDTKMIADGMAELGRNANTNTAAPAPAFVGGLLLASSLCCAGFAVLYSLFSRTLEAERDVFSYPAVIPRKGRVGT